MSDRHAHGSLMGSWLTELFEMPVLPDVPDVTAWVREQRVRIGTENTSYQGEYYDFARFPVISRLIVDFFQDPDARELFVMKPVQTTFTTTVTFCVGHDMLFRGGNTIFVLHDRDSAREKVKDDVAPILRKIPALGESEEEAEVESTVGALRFTHGIIRIGSGGTKATLTSIPAKNVVLDECELHPLIDGAHSINRARDRLTGALDGGKLIAGSKPEKEAIIERDERTRVWKLKPRDGAHLHAAYLSGNQLRYECRCPHCGRFTEPKFQHLRFAQCNEALEGMPPAYNFARIEKETYWECPECRGAVHEGAEKEAWVRAGRWVEKPAAERDGKEIYARPVPHRWSAQFSALTDIAFESLRWGNIAIKFLEAQNDSAALRAFNNGILGKPEPLVKSDDTTMQHLRRLIPRPIAPGGVTPSFYVPPYRIRGDDGRTLGSIPMLSTQIHYMGMCVDTQDRSFKFTVRAHGKDGTMPLIDYGEFPWSKEAREITDYIDTTLFETMDGRKCGVTLCYIDPKGHHWQDVMDLSMSHQRIECAAGEGRHTIASKQSGPVWKSQYNRKGGGGVVEYWTHASNHWEDRLYEDCIQKFDRARYRYWAPAMWMPSDVCDRFLEEHMAMQKVFGKRGPEWVKVGTFNDWGDCSKLHLIMDWNMRLKKKVMEREPAGGKMTARQPATAKKRPRVVIA